MRFCKGGYRLNYKGNTNCLNIPSIDAKDLYIANHQVKKDSEVTEMGYSLTYINNGKREPNLRKYVNTYDFSLDLIELRQYVQKSGKNKGIGKKDFSFFVGNRKDKEYSNIVINVTFKYSVKKFNRVSPDTYIKHGYEYENLSFHNCIATTLVWDDKVGEYHEDVVGVKINQLLGETQCCDKLPSMFYVSRESDTSHQIKYCIKENLNHTIKDVAELRKILYKDGFRCNGRNYVRFKRSSGSSRVGKCLFIVKELYDHMHKWEMCGLKVKHEDEIDLAALEAYISLPTSSIIDTIDIDPKTILIIDDFESVFKDTVVETSIGNDGWLHTEEKEIEVHNSIWDGQSLIDKSVMGEYDQYGMLLLRNKFFKSCCFNTNIQKWFEDNNITNIEQLNGLTLAKNVSDIKVITTPNSIKYLKFGTVRQWLNNLPNMFGVVKHEKKTHFFDGDMVQTHYQLLNTLQLSESEVKEFLQPSFDYMNKLNTDIDVLKYHIKCQSNDDYNFTTMNDVIYSMLNITEDFKNTKIFNKFRNDLLYSFRKNLKKGHVLVNGNYSVLFGNPMEMLRSTIGIFDYKHTSLLSGEVYNKRFENDQELLCCRSPHVTIGNILVAKNKYVSQIDDYFNLTDEIICLNSINDNILERLSGCDFDSDQMLITDNSILLDAAKKNYAVFKVPTSNVHARKVQRKYTPEDQADLDIRTSNNLIGEIINLSQQLNSQLWNIANNSNKSIETLYNTNSNFRELYFDICQLDVMSCIEIDKAKKEFDVDSKAEIKRIQKRHIVQDDKTGKNIFPYFLGVISQIKGYDKKNNATYQYLKTTMDYLVKLINSHYSEQYWTNFKKISDVLYPQKYDPNKVLKPQLKAIIDSFEKLYADHIRIMCIDADYCSSDQKRKLYNDVKQETFNMLYRLKLNEHTAYRLLRYIDQDKLKTKQYLLEYLSIYLQKFYNYNHQTVNLMKVSKNEYYDLSLYGIHFAKQKS